MAFPLWLAAFPPLSGESGPFQLLLISAPALGALLCQGPGLCVPALVYEPLESVSAGLAPSVALRPLRGNREVSQSGTDVKNDLHVFR